MRAATVTAPKGARVVDSARVLTSTQIRSLGAVATCRYYAPLVNGKPSWKCLTPAEIVELHAGGIGIIPNWESSATRPLSGSLGGTADGREFARQLAVHGVPLEVLVVVSCDMNATVVNRAQVEAYFRAALGELRRAGYTHCGVYGDTDLFAWLSDLDPRPVGWLMASSSFSSGTAGASIRQRLQGAWGQQGGIPTSVYDPNDVLVDVKGVWLPHDEPDQHPDVLPPILMEDDMAFIITAPDRNPAQIDAGYAVGLSASSLATTKLTVEARTNEEWDEIVAISNGRKAADRAAAQPVTVNVPPVEVKFPTYTSTPA